MHATKMKTNPRKYAAALAACHTTVMALGVVIVMSHASARAQYGDRVWAPPVEGTFQSLQLGGTNAAPMPFLPFDPTEVPVLHSPGDHKPFRLRRLGSRLLAA